MDGIWMHGKQKYLASGIAKAFGWLQVSLADGNDRIRGNKGFANRNGETLLKNKHPGKLFENRPP